MPGKGANGGGREVERGREPAGFGRWRLRETGITCSRLVASLSSPRLGQALPLGAA